ncbi:hypothetical protein Q4F19_19540 [Sphingomonas sp. BIUV-7]|uniref:Uncharacterized protein n=1 Tax=Sphingomonas natans TaxID=3063330 RepID=A0ABT8YDX8_9SPHN|nr:hypothetical protein [Sphingomonas sp. BIUV-7]MDO6416586.1 hypothetical protein [Sphingomonas sp. BIUV-7]
MFRPALPPSLPPKGWWNSGWFLILMVLAAAIPLIWPGMPPLTDLPGHMGRYRVEISDPASPLRQLYYGYEWRFLANLGVDIAILPMARLFGLELGLKLIVLTIPPLMAAGLLWTAREAHGRVTPPALFALPLTYSFPFIWGFLNFSFSMALALNAFALWLRLGRQGRFSLRAWLFVPIGILLTVAHIFGWAVLCLLAFAAEVVRQRDRGTVVWRSLWNGGWACISLAPPILLLLAWRMASGAADGVTENADFFYWRAKYIYLLSALRAQWMVLDIACVYLLWGLIAFGLGGVWVRMNRTLGIASLVLMIAYALLPRILLNSAYADMRLAPYVIAIGTIALTLKSSVRWQSAAVAGAATFFYAGRLLLLTLNFAQHDAANARQLEALDHIRPYSRVFVQASLQCLGQWETTRMDHLGSMAIVRRGAFMNGQWADPGAQLLVLKYVPPDDYDKDPSQILRPYRCRQADAKTYPEAVNALPRGAFDYVWLINLPKGIWASFPGLMPIWTGEKAGILYKVMPEHRFLPMPNLPKVKKRKKGLGSDPTDRPEKP